MRRILLSILLIVSLCVQAENLFEMGIHGGAGSWAASTDYIHPQMGLQGGAHLYYNYLSESVFGFRLGVTVDHHALGWQKTDCNMLFGRSECRFKWHYPIKALCFLPVAKHLFLLQTHGNRAYKMRLSPFTIRLMTIVCMSLIL